MAITREEVLHTARLARLALSDDEVDRLKDQLENILGYIRKIDTLDTRDIVPTSHAVEMGTPFREDAVRPFGDREAILSNAPDRHGEFFRVPRIIEH